MMANNRMFLLHRPTRLALCLGKRLGFGWYNPPSEERFMAFYDYLESLGYGGNQDDFVLAQEDCSDSTCFDDWKYSPEGSGEGGFLKLNILEKEETP